MVPRRSLQKSVENPVTGLSAVSTRSKPECDVPANHVGSVLPLVYEELRRLASVYLGDERADHTLQPTALVHEAFLKLVEQPTRTWQSPAHLKAVAAHAMRQVLVDYARRHGSLKRGGSRKRISLDASMIELKHNEIDLIDLEEALQTLAERDFRQSRVVELRFYGGLSIDETAEVLGVSPSTVSGDWTFAKVWLARELALGDS